MEAEQVCFDHNGMLKTEAFKRNRLIKTEINKYMAMHREFTMWQVRKHILSIYPHSTGEYDIARHFRRIKRDGKLKVVSKLDKWNVYRFKA